MSTKPVHANPATDATEEAKPWGLPEFNARSMPTVDDLESMVLSARQQAVIEGRAEGYTKGYKEGYAQGSAAGTQAGTQKAYEEHAPELQRQVERFVALIECLSSPLAQLDEQVEAALLEMAIAAAHAVLRIRLQRDDALLMQVVREALSAAGQQGTALELRVSPEDCERIESALGAMETSKPRIQVDAELAGGDVRVHAESLRIDASLAARLETFVKNASGSKSP